MKFTGNLQEGKFLKRYKRFFADIEWQGQVVVAHVPNTGSLKSVNLPGQPCLFSVSDNPDRKLKYTLEMIQAPSKVWVGVNTANPNTAMRQLLAGLVGKSGQTGDSPFAFWSSFDSVKPEFKINAETRLDFALIKNGSDKMHFIEVKNVTLAEDKIAKFPDAVTERGQKHLVELMRLQSEGHSTEILFFIQREDCQTFAAAADIDPEYARLLQQAAQAGVRITPIAVRLSPESIEVQDRTLPIKFVQD